MPIWNYQSRTARDVADALRQAKPHFLMRQWVTEAFGNRIIKAI